MDCGGYKSKYTKQDRIGYQSKSIYFLL